MHIVGRLIPKDRNSAEGVADPYPGNAAAIEECGRTMIEMNCASRHGCRHGYGFKGGMGSDLADTYWRYGGSPALIFKSICEGVGKVCQRGVDFFLM